MTAPHEQVVPDHQQEQRAVDEPVPVGLPELRHDFRLLLRPILEQWRQDGHRDDPGEQEDPGRAAITGHRRIAPQERGHAVEEPSRTQRDEKAKDPSLTDCAPWFHRPPSTVTTGASPPAAAAPDEPLRKLGVKRFSSGVFSVTVSELIAIRNAAISGLTTCRSQ